MAERELSEMEVCVLALIWSDGPCTPYAVRQVFLKSPSPQWSGSAGSIYPLVERLKKRKLIRSTAHSTGRRQGRLLAVTPAGIRAVETWLEPVIPDWVAGVPADPLRTRIRFLGALPPMKQKAFLKSALESMERLLAEMRRDYPERRARGGFEFWMARGAMMAMRSRLSWLRQLAQAVGSLPGSRYT
ncbi:MAG TPA: PadR family transcriptional regulator [Bryobacteraceae bacterium]|nr:PadR family transcriptional regulator [Bryobacteraceae bacterium]